MKNALFVFLFGLPSVAFAQVLPAFPTEFADWHEVYLTTDPAASPPVTAYHTNYSALPSAVSDSLMDVYEDGDLIGAVYADEHRIWFQRSVPDGPNHLDVDLTPLEWYLVYDFSMEPGDTAYTDYFLSPSPEAVIVDSIRIDTSYGHPVKWFYLSNDDIIVEKIGSTYGFFRPFMSHFESVSLLCSFDGYFGSEGVGWFSSVSVCGSNGVNDALSFPDNRVFPNPVSGDVLQLDISFDAGSFEIAAVSGQRVLAGPVVNSGIGILPLPPGTYLLYLSDGAGQRAVLRFVRE